MDPYKTFNTNLKFFMRELMQVYPNVLELKLMFSLYKLMKTVSKKAPQKYFYSIIHPNSKQLLSKELDYFFTIQYEDTTIQKMIGPLKSEYDQMSEENKDMIWKHLIVLYKLSLQCDEQTKVNQTQELQPLQELVKV